MAFVGISASCKAITFMLLRSADVKVPQFYRNYTASTLLYCYITVSGEFTAVLKHFKTLGGKHWVATYTRTEGFIWATDISPELLRLMTVI